MQIQQQYYYCIVAHALSTTTSTITTIARARLSAYSFAPPSDRTAV